MTKGGYYFHINHFIYNLITLPNSPLECASKLQPHCQSKAKNTGIDIEPSYKNEKHKYGFRKELWSLHSGRNIFHKTALTLDFKNHGENTNKDC